ncbi:filamentation induced by cAMP protein Fic [Emticicia oligotrophica DSM 17448]|uniref:protein adenylyltransferase n=1 Tax=Emticicia oligotrophica (strain DSM 17448 / CIP 109782 / MTCC 6937 / GPTSA100-15) TaxID=929562 RepID=A0ABM5MZT7_EMTOG|nr:Fic family protein [Emticicia oligotrophica]AFK02674.1 filamentation induced by cAMP protein Fic [Emticicia oligotrophica DSM 17448]
MKYQTSYDQNENLPNKQGLLNKDEIDLAEFEGFLTAEILLTDKLTSKTKFDLKYIQNIHLLALGELYDFAGKWRTVNLSKGGYVFASAQFLDQTMQYFEDEMLKNLPKRYASKEDLLNDVAKIHAELLFIHPFREGNGRAARILANLMCRKYGYEPPNWELISKDEKEPLNFGIYVKAVQQAANQDYTLMQQIFRQISLS